MPLSDRWEFRSEFKWEKFLRKNDARIAIFFRELPKYIDLPGETEILEHKVFQQIPADSVWNDVADIPGNPFSGNDCATDEDEEESENNSGELEDLNQRDGAGIFIVTGQLSHIISCLLAESPCEEATLFYTQNLTVLGKIMAQMQIIMELEPENHSQLRTAVLKRVIKNFTDLYNAFSRTVSTPDDSMEYYVQQDEIHAYFQAVMKDLMNMRQAAIDLLKKARH